MNKYKMSKKTIQTRYLGPTNSRGARVKAFDLFGNKTIVPWDYELDIVSCHFNAAAALAAKMGWEYSRMEVGYIKDGCVFLLIKEGSL